MYSPEMERIPCVIMRSGTSKGIYLLSNDLPEDPETRDKVILSILRQPGQPSDRRPWRRRSPDQQAARYQRVRPRGR